MHASQLHQVSTLALGFSAAPALRSVPARAAAPLMQAKSTALPFADCPKALDGSMAGDVGFDPLGFSDFELGPFDSAEQHMGWMREAELKHGRVCMLATVGWIGVDQGAKAYGLPAELQGLSSYQAHDAAVAQGSLLILLIFCGVFEIAGAGGIAATLEGKRVPGDFALTGGFGKTPEQMAKLKQAEIKHARLAMMAFSGIATQSAVNGGIGFPYF